jgi:hypothetical protein
MTTAAPHITKHAIDRYVERVNHNVSREEARMAIQRLAMRGRARPNPRHWMNDRSHSGGERYVYWSQQPDVCAVLISGAVTTIITRALTKHAPPNHLRLLLQPAEPSITAVPPIYAGGMTADSRMRRIWDGSTEDHGFGAAA